MSRQAQQASGLTPLQGVPSRTELVVEELMVAILRGDLAPGSRLIERNLAQMLNVSTTPVREALRVLERKGLVQSNSFRGAEVVVVDRALAEGVYEVRALLEPVAVAEAVRFQDERSLEAIESALEAAHRAGSLGDMGELSMHNRHFHRLLYEPCRNDVLRSVLDELQDRVALITVSGWRRRQSWQPEYDEHRSILEAVRRGHAEEAAEQVRRHIEGFSAGLFVETDE